MDFIGDICQFVKISHVSLLKSKYILLKLTVKQ